MSIRSILLVFVCVATPSIAFAQNDETTLKKRFSKGVAEAYKRCRQSSFRATCVVKHSKFSAPEEFQPQTSTPGREREFECAFRGPMSLQRRTDKPGLEEFRIKNNSYAFGLSRPLNKNSGAVHSGTLLFLEKLGISSGTDAKISEIEQQCRSLSFNAFHLFGYPLATLIQDKNFRLKTIIPDSSESGEKMRVEYEYELNDSISGTHLTYSNGYLICDPNNEWGLVEYGAKVQNHLNKDSSTHRVKLVYGDPISGIPFVKRLEDIIEWDTLDGKKMSSVEHLVSITSTEEVPEKEFYLSHYGLQEPNFSRSWFDGSFWYLIAGALCVVVGTFLLRRRRQARS